MDNAEVRIHLSRSDSKEQLLSDNQLPHWEYPTSICLPSYAGQPQNLLAHPRFSPLPHSLATTEPFGGFTGRLPHGSLYTPAVTGTVDFPGPCHSQWSEMSSSLTHEAHASVPRLQNQYQILHAPPCGWSRDYEPLPVPSDIPSIPQSLSQAGQHDAWMRHVLDGSVDTCAASPDGDTGLSSTFFGAFTDYDFPFDTRADLQSSIAPTRNAMPPIQSVAVPCRKPTCGPDHRQARTSECRWLTNGAPCEALVVADRRSVIEHLQHVHGIKPGEEKARQTCRWERCRTTLKKESLARHVLTVHLKEGVHCAECGQFFAREDSLKRHLKGGQHTKVPPDRSAA